ncbi:MFS transporter [Rhizobium rhizoryzae]|uniref:MFS transporter n=1 Tax=Rhizobium rhizoryzae TaxID=451876 RepID=UPI00289FA88E|nr:MFS transporter [Rhizobium rhizoryzae]
MDQQSSHRTAPEDDEPTATGWRQILGAPYGLRLLAISAGIGLHAFNEVAIAPVLPIALEALGGIAFLPFVYAAFFAFVIVGGLSASPLRRRFGARLALSGAGVIYLVGIFIQFTALNAPMLLAGRVAQGLADGWIVALSYSLIADLFPPKLVPRIFAVEAVLWAAAAVLGPFAGGLTVEHVGWRAALAVSVPVVALFFIVMPFALPKEKRAETPVTPHRLIPPRLFTVSSTVGCGSWLLFLMMCAQSVSTVFLAYTLHHRLGLAPVKVGLVLITLSMSWSVAAIPIGGIDNLAMRQRIMRIGPLLQICGAALVSSGLYTLVLPLVLVGQVFNGVGFAMAFASASHAVIEDADPEHRMTTSALLPSLETSGFVFGSSVIGGLASLFGAQAQLSAQTPTSAIFYLWGASACLSGLAFFAAKGVTVKLRQD